MKFSVAWSSQGVLSSLGCGGCWAEPVLHVDAGLSPVCT